MLRNTVLDEMAYSGNNFGNLPNDLGIIPKDKIGVPPPEKCAIF